MIVEDEEIRGLFVSDECICRNCITNQELDKALDGELILRWLLEIEPKYLYCQRCHMRIN